MDTLEEHLRSPEVSIAAHIESRADALEQSLRGKTAIYLDTRFWVMVREVRDGTSLAPSERKIVHHLEGLVHHGLAYCPIAEPTFHELMKQGDVAQRIRTATAIDDLSLGVAILPDHERMAMEASAHLARKLCPNAPLAPVRARTRATFVLGNHHVIDDRFSATDALAIQKSFYDHMWERTVAEIAQTLDGDQFTQQDARVASARKLNAENAAHRAEMRSFEMVFEQECHGVAQAIADIFPDIVGYFTALGDQARMVFLNIIREHLKSDQARALPSAHVHAFLHALFRWDYRDRDMTPNDIVDFGHAAAAIGYCDLFLTERALAHALTHRRLSLADVHRCTVASERADVLAQLLALRRRGRQAQNHCE